MHKNLKTVVPYVAVGGRWKVWVGDGRVTDWRETIILVLPILKMYELYEWSIES